jgi:hypothetical protein
VETVPNPVARRDQAPALWHRDTIRVALYATEITPGAYDDMDQQLHDRLVQQYRQLQPRLRDVGSSVAPDTEQHATLINLALTAIGLLTFGHLEVLATLGTLIPLLPRASLRNRPYSFILGSVRAILPLPRALDVYREPEVVVIWLRAHHTRLQWDETERTYHLIPEA